MVSQRAVWVAAGLFGVGLAVGLCQPFSVWSPAQAQQRLPVETVTRENALTLEAERAKLYDELAAESDFLERQSRIVRLAARVMSDTVVHIDASKKVPRNGGESTLEETGSGVLVALGRRPGECYVLTNSHVIRGAALEQISIKLADARVIKPLQLWEDPATDIAVIRVPSRGLVTARLGDSDRLDIGDFVLAVGSPFGLDHSVTFGIVSAKGRRDLELGDNQVKFQDFIQTDAAINPGNSGGPLVNLRGEVVGINTAIASNSGVNAGIGFSIPINMVMHVAGQLIENGIVERAFLGVTLDPQFGPAAAVRLGLPGPRGARVTAIRAGTPAETAKLREGDVILQFNGINIDDDAHLINVVSLTPVGGEVPIVVWRDRQAVQLQVTLGDRAKLERQPERRSSTP